MKTNKTLIKELREELRYWQMQVRLDLRSLKGSIARCRDLGREMTLLAKEERERGKTVGRGGK